MRSIGFAIPGSSLQISTSSASATMRVHGIAQYSPRAVTQVLLCMVHRSMRSHFMFCHVLLPALAWRVDLSCTAHGTLICIKTTRILIMALEHRGAAFD